LLKYSNMAITITMIILDQRDLFPREQHQLDG